MIPSESSAKFADAFTDTHMTLPGIAVGSAFIAEQGAQVLSWRDGSGRERLYLSPTTGGMTRDDRDNTHAIRGGMPISFPQFSERGTLPKHGFVRNMRWSCDGDNKPAVDGGQAALTLVCRDDAHSRQIWPQGFLATLRAEVQADRLAVTLSVTNSGDTACEFTVALHTYFHVDDVRNVRLQGLQGVSYQDATNNNALVVQADADLTVTQELDRVYLSPPKTLILQEQGVASLQIEQTGFEDSVVWNPGLIKAAQLPDMPDADWLRMICVEAACVAMPVKLHPGEQWSGSQILTVLR